MEMSQLACMLIPFFPGQFVTVWKITTKILSTFFPKKNLNHNEIKQGCTVYKNLYYLFIVY